MKHILNLISKYKRNGVVRLAQEKTVEYIERTEVAGNIITTNNKEQDNKMETNESLNITIPFKLVMESLAKDQLVIDAMHEKIKDQVDTMVENSLDLTVDELIEDKLTSYVHENDIWDKISDDIDNAIDNKLSDFTDSSDTVTSDWIVSNLDTYNATAAINLCSLGKSVWNAITGTISEDIKLHIDKIKEGADITQLTEFDTSVIQLVKLATIVSENTTRKVIEEEKQKYLANREEYLVGGADKLNQPSITVDQFIQFINGLELYQVAKDKIIEEFKKIIPNSNN